MVNVAEMLRIIPTAIDIALKLVLLSVAIFFGRIAISGWKDRLDILTKIIGTILLGFICFIVGILLPFDFFPQIKFISEMINSFIIAIILYTILVLLSVKKAPEFLTKKDFFAIRKEVEFLKSEIAKINRALIQSGIEPRPISKKEVENIIDEKMKKVKIKRYDIEMLDFIDNLWKATIRSGKRTYLICIDPMGEIKEFKKQGFDIEDILTRLREDKFFLIGSIIAIAFLIMVFSLLTPANINRVSETFSFYGVGIEQKTKCLSVESLLKKWNNNENRTSQDYDLTKIDSTIDNYLGEDLWVSPFLYDLQVIVKDETGVYAAFFVTDEKIDSMPKSLSVLQTAIISGSSYVCSVELTSNTVCSCESPNKPMLSIQITTLLNNMAQELQ